MKGFQHGDNSEGQDPLQELLNKILELGRHVDSQMTPHTQSAAASLLSHLFASVSSSSSLLPPPPQNWFIYEDEGSLIMQQKAILLSIEDDEASVYSCHHLTGAFECCEYDLGTSEGIRDCVEKIQSLVKLGEQ